MIGKQIKGSGFKGTLSYVLSKEGAEFVTSNMLSETAEELSSEFSASRSLRPNLSKCVYHASLSLAEGENLSNKQWGEVANKYIENMGFSGSQFVAVKHTDTEHQHIHIVASRIRLDGTVVSDSNDYKRSEGVIRGFEKTYGLKQVLPSREVERSAPTGGELRKAIRENNPSVKMQLQDLVSGATKNKPSMTTFIDRLENQGVGVLPNIAKTGTVTGISFVLNGEQMKGSDLGRGYTWKGLLKKGITYEHDREIKELKNAKYRCEGLLAASTRAPTERNESHRGGRLLQGLSSSLHSSGLSKSNNKRVGKRNEKDDLRNDHKISKSLLGYLFDGSGDAKEGMVYDPPSVGVHASNKYNSMSSNREHLLRLAQGALRAKNKSREMGEVREGRFPKAISRRANVAHQATKIIDDALSPYIERDNRIKEAKEEKKRRKLEWDEQAKRRTLEREERERARIKKEKQKKLELERKTREKSRSTGFGGGLSLELEF